jgi:hypothetical protein
MIFYRLEQIASRDLRGNGMALRWHSVADAIPLAMMSRWQAEPIETPLGPPQG